MSQDRLQRQASCLDTENPTNGIGPAVADKRTREQMPSDTSFEHFHPLGVSLR